MALLLHAIPNDVAYRTIWRKQSNMTEAILRRLIKSDAITKDSIKGYRAKMLKHGINNPYLDLENGANGDDHRRYTQFGKMSVQ